VARPTTGESTATGPGKAQASKRMKESQYLIGYSIRSSDKLWVVFGIRMNT